MATQPNIVAHGATDVGRQRERNEDAFFVGKLLRTMFVQETNVNEQHATWLTGGSEGWLLVVADGMGGQGSGDIASRSAVVAVTEYLCKAMPWSVKDVQPRGTAVSLPGVREQLVEAVSVGESTVRQAATKPNVSARMGTTLTLAYILWPNLYTAHVGDSRCYLWRGGQLSRLTTDHTIAERLVDKGLAGINPSSRWHHILWNALGADESQAQPEVSRIELNIGDQILLCSDGLTGHLDDRTLLQILDAGTPVDQTCQHLISAANEAGGTDNITAIVARFASAMIANHAHDDATGPHALM
jgi:serine/threonine protein phosphatase PrpC